jgi:hypothetical protein
MVERLQNYIERIITVALREPRPGLTFRKYKVAPRLGTQIVRRRLLSSLYRRAILFS